MSPEWQGRLSQPAVTAEKRGALDWSALFVLGHGHANDHMQPSGSRAERIADQIKDQVSQLLAFEVKDPAIGLLTVTHVKMASDMGLAHVYYTLVGDDAERSRTARALDRATPFVRRRLAEDMNMRRAPEVRFHYDENLERQERVETLLREIASEREAREARERAATTTDDGGE